MKAKTRKPQKPRPGYSLAEHNPELMSEYSEKNEYPASRLCFGADYPVWWKCPKGHKDYEATPKSRTRKKAPARCDKCRYGDISKKHSTPSKEKSLGYLYPDLIPFWSSKNTKSPSEVYAYSDSEEYWWICPKHIHKNYLMNCYRRTTALIGCPGCSHTGIPPYKESLGYLYPNLAKEWFVGNELTSYEVWPGGSYLAEWVCPKGHKNYPATCYNKTRGRGCPRCRPNQTSKAEKNLRCALLPYGASQEDITKISNWTVDIYFPEKKTIVEYDGSYYHSFEGCWKRDRRKSLELLEMGYKVIKIRTYFNAYKLWSLDIKNQNYHEIFYEEPRKSIHPQNLIDKIISLI